MAQYANTHSVHPNLYGEGEADYGLNLPSFPDISLPSFELPDGPSFPSMPSVALPSIGLSVPDFELPDFDYDLDVPRPQFGLAAPSFDVALPNGAFPSMDVALPNGAFPSMDVALPTGGFPEYKGFQVKQGLAPWSPHPNLCYSRANPALPTAAMAARARFPASSFDLATSTVHPNFGDDGSGGADVVWQTGRRWPELPPQPQLPAPPQVPGIDSVFGFYDGKPEFRGPELSVTTPSTSMRGPGQPYAGVSVGGYTGAAVQNFGVAGIRPTRTARPECIHPNLGEGYLTMAPTPRPVEP